MVAAMMFVAAATGYAVRSSLSLSLLAMVNVRDANGTLLPLPDVSVHGV